MIKKKSCRNCKHLKEVYYDVQGFFSIYYKCSEGHYDLIGFNCEDYEKIGDTE